MPARTHGLSHTRSYQKWAGMIARCIDTNHRSFKNYGGRGIKVCERWRYSYEAFTEDMGERPSPQHSIDRINNDGDYEPGNCRWALPVDQSNNRRGNNFLVVEGRRQTITDWSRETGIPRHTLLMRIRRGWPAEVALRTPPRHSFIKANGKTQTASQWARELGISTQRISERLKRGWSPMMALGLSEGA